MTWNDCSTSFPPSRNGYIERMKRVIATLKAPAAIGPYSQGVAASGDFLFTAGQIPIVPSTGELVQGGIRAQTAQALDNLQAILEAGGSSLEGVVKTTVYLIDLGDFAAMNEVYAGYFKNDPPARSTVQVSRLPRDVRIEIDAMGVITST